MKKVADILKRKGASVISVLPATPVLEVLQLMADKNIGSVLVMEGNEYHGLLTERDYARKVILKGKRSAETTAGDIMSIGLPRITPDNSIEVCMHLMSENNIRYLPVFENDSICGIISINDVVKETILTHEETIAQLKEYMHGNM
ncbi:MAG: CBS domain-containing protein [Flavihumibacter sp.]|nr:CBS domain-containing protein [Flavihumibacter sp.]